MRTLLLLGIVVGGCSGGAIPATGECRWNLSQPESSGSAQAVFDYAAHSGCIGPTEGSTANFGFNIELPVGDKLTRFDWGVPGYPVDGAIVDLAAPSTVVFVSANGWACSAFDGTATVLSSAPSHWRVELAATCRDDGHAVTGAFEGDTAYGYAIN